MSVRPSSSYVRGNELPHDSICFRKPHLPNPRVSADDVRDAKAKITLREQQEGQPQSAMPVVAARAMRAQADWQV